MRPRSTPRLRTALGLVVLTAAAALAVVPAPAAVATSIDGYAGVSAGVSNAGGTCSATSGDSDETVFASDNSPVSMEASDDGTVTDSGDAGDITDWEASGEQTVRSKSGPGAALGFTASARIEASVDAAQGEDSECSASANVEAGGEALVDVPTAGWLTLKAKAPAGMIVELMVMDDDSTQQFQYGEYGPADHQARMFLDAGQHYLSWQFTVYTDSDPDSLDRESVSGTGTLSATFGLPGAAVGPTTGSGKAQVAMAGGVNCVDRSAVVTFTKKAKGAASASFSVSGKKKGTVKKPSPGTSYVVKGLNPTTNAIVKVTLKPAKGKPKTATRTYLACS